VSDIAIAVTFDAKWRRIRDRRDRHR
jgi:hypothetical protein